MWAAFGFMGWTAAVIAGQAGDLSQWRHGEWESTDIAHTKRT